MKSRFSGIEIFLFSVLALLIDIIDLVPFLDIVASIGSVIIFQFYFKMKGVKGTHALIGNIIDIIPILGYLPLTTVGVVGTMIIEKNPQLKTIANNQHILGAKRHAASPVKGRIYRPPTFRTETPEPQPQTIEIRPRPTVYNQPGNEHFKETA